MFLRPLGIIISIVRRENSLEYARAIIYPCSTSLFKVRPS